MFRAFEILLIVMILSITGYTFYIKYQSEARLAEIKDLEVKIIAYRENINLLEAHWSLLNQPARVQKLIEVFQGQLKLKTTEPNQIVKANELPDFKSEPGDGKDQIADHIRTGSVK